MDRGSIEWGYCSPTKWPKSRPWQSGHMLPRPRPHYAHPHILGLTMHSSTWPLCHCLFWSPLQSLQVCNALQALHKGSGIGILRGNSNIPAALYDDHSRCLCAAGDHRDGFREAKIPHFRTSLLRYRMPFEGKPPKIKKGIRQEMPTPCSFYY